MQHLNEIWPPERERAYTEFGKAPSDQVRIRFEGEADPSSDDFNLALAEEWRERHVVEYGRLVNALVSAKQSNRMRPFRHMHESIGIYFDHNLDAPMARLIMADVPSLRGCIRTRASKVDGYV